VRDSKRILAPIGRVLFGIIFVLASFQHFTKEAIGYAASQGTPLANIAVPFSGALALVGGLSIILGYRAKLGAWLIVIFLAAVTLFMHRFWMMSDPIMMRVQQAMFMKNLSMLGGALLIAYHGAGPISFDARHEHASGK
jgi:putative oxidoreductase